MATVLWISKKNKKKTQNISAKIKKTKNSSLDFKLITPLQNVLKKYERKVNTMSFTRTRLNYKKKKILFSNDKKVFETSFNLLAACNLI